MLWAKHRKWGESERPMKKWAKKNRDVASQEGRATAPYDFGGKKRHVYGIPENNLLLTGVQQR